MLEEYMTGEVRRRNLINDNSPYKRELLKTLNIS